MKKPTLAIRPVLTAVAAAALLVLATAGCQCNQTKPENPAPHNGADGKDEPVRAGHPGPHN